MKLNKFEKLILCAVCLSLVLVVIPSLQAYAGIDAIKTDGKYKAPVSNDLFMGGDNLSDTAIIEKSGDHCYVTFTVKNADQMTNLKLVLSDGEVGCIMKRDNDSAHYTYSISEKELEKSLHFKAYVPAMNKHIETNLMIDLKNVEKISDKIDDLGERPAEFLPTIEVNAADSELEKGTTFLIPKAKGLLCGEEIEVKVSAYYLNDGNKEDIDIASGQMLLDKVGIYHVVYRAESDKYKTLLDNNTSAEIDITIVSKIGAVSIVKADKDTLPKGCQLQAAYIKSGETFDKISEMMKGKYDNFEIINVDIFDAEGKDMTLENDTGIYLKACDAYNRNKIVLYSFNDEGELTKLDFENYGRYIKTDIKEQGTFVICLEGVAFVMPMWAYAAIAFALLAAIIAIIVVIIVLARRKKRRS